jgi:hypothetical protein
MTPKLPPNSMVLTPPPKMARTEAGVAAFFGARTVLFAEVRAELQILRDWDNYERCTSPDREAAKRALRRLLNGEP